MDDDYIQDIFPHIVGLHEQPPRNYSDIAVGKTLQAISTEIGAFLYGEAADAFFGEEDFEHFWFAICLDELLSQVIKLSRTVLAAA